MKCRECGDEIYEYEDGLCWYCEEDEKEPDIGSGSSIGQNPGLSRQWLRVRVPSTPPLNISYNLNIYI